MVLTALLLVAACSAGPSGSAHTIANKPTPSKGLVPRPAGSDRCFGVSEADVSTVVGSKQLFVAAGTYHANGGDGPVPPDKSAYCKWGNPRFVALLRSHTPAPDPTAEEQFRADLDVLGGDNLEIGVGRFSSVGDARRYYTQAVRLGPAADYMPHAGEWDEGSVYTFRAGPPGCHAKARRGRLEVEVFMHLKAGCRSKALTKVMDAVLNAAE